MKSKLISITVFFLVTMMIVTGILYFGSRQANSQDVKAEQIVALNEIEQLVKAGEYEQVSENIEQLQNDMRKVENVSNGNIGLFVMFICCVVFLLTVFGYVYFAVLRPFDKMKHFAGEVAKGNFDVTLNYERSNYFGEFTWAFDSMRREITKARACEHQAIENNKTVIATLSHDIKTPIASIRAYTEGLEANLDGTVEKRQMYLNVIMKKCDEVSKLTNDLFLHSLSDLDKLKMTPENFELCAYMENAIMEIGAGQGDIHFAKPDFTVTVSADANRLLQIAENLINNARKYAKTDIDISITKEDGLAKIHFKDYGKGISDEDIPFIFDKFYRGKNCGNEQGSGLGLYIVKYIAGQMGGEVSLHNCSNGLEVVVSLPVKKGA